MIQLDMLDKNKERFRMQYLLAKPFPYLCIDGICNEAMLLELYTQIPDLQNKSRDYMFANNKFEKSNYRSIGPLFEELYSDLTSDKMNAFLSFIGNEDIFVDPANHGGGLHQGKAESFLDMHLDFNYHPIHPDWFRNMNLLLYLNYDWQAEHGGQLKLQDLRSGEKESLAVPFNRLIIQQTRAFTLHGYDRTNFPAGRYRTSIATYAYTKHRHHVEKPRTTDWFVKDGQPVKQAIASVYGPAVKLKNALFGSRTAKNQ